MRLGPQHVFIEFTMSSVSNGITKGCQWGYYLFLLPVGIRHFISSLWGCHLWNWGKWYLFLELWGFANVYQHFPLCLAQKMSLILVAISLVIIVEEKLLKAEVRLPLSVNWKNLFETLLEMFGFTCIQFGFPVPWHPWERLFMVLGWSWWLGYLEKWSLKGHRELGVSAFEFWFWCPYSVLPLLTDSTRV